MDAASPSCQEEQGHPTVSLEPPKRPGSTKFHETRVLGAEGSRLWLGTLRSAEIAARAHDAAALALSCPDACLNFADSAWRMLPVLAAGSFGFGSAREVKDIVAVAVVAFQRRLPFAPAPSALFYMSPTDLLELDDKRWFGGMVARPYYESLAHGMLVEPPDGGMVETPLWNYLFE